MCTVGRASRNADRYEGHEGGDKVQTGMGSFGQNTEASGSQPDHYLECGEGDSRD
jgi:hypothetical protein